MFLALFSEYEVNLSDSTEAISYIMAIVELGKKYANGKFHYHLKWIFCPPTMFTLRQKVSLNDYFPHTKIFSYYIKFCIREEMASGVFQNSGQSANE